LKSNSKNNAACNCPFQLVTLPLGQWKTNCYVLIGGGESIIVDPAAEPERILAAVEGTAVKAILLTHGHLDHVQGLDAVRQATGAPLGLHPADAVEFGIVGDFDLDDGDVLTLGGGQVTVVHTPGHTPGSVCFRFGRCAIVGDTLFPGGPGHSRTPGALAQILASLRDKVFAWPDDTVFYPGHGEGSTIGTVRPAFEAFMARPRSPELCGDVEWV
jgi:glyoxylase-like metal-dependent hydrolase (beta-lactamase superfamily II)